MKPDPGALIVRAGISISLFEGVADEGQVFALREGHPRRENLFLREAHLRQVVARGPVKRTPVIVKQKITNII